MPQLLALEWDGSEARVVVAATRGEQPVIEQAFSVSLLPREPGDQAAKKEAAEVDVGQRIAAALSARGVGRIETLVAVGRSSIELRQLSLPPAPANELPEMVRFQAMREFNELDESWLLDFVPIDQTPDGPQNVLAAAIGPELVGQIQQTCHTAGLKPRRLVLRPCAAASLLGRAPGADSDRPRLLVDLLSDEADLTVMIGRKVVFLRTARMSGDPLSDEGPRRALLGEIRRTIAAAQNQLGGRRVESIVLCGTRQEHAALAGEIEQSLGTRSEPFDPFDSLTLSRRLQRDLPEHPGRFAPLLGMALAELEGTGQAIDFLHPRRRVEPPRKQARFVAAGMAVALLVVLFFGWRYFERRSLVKERKALNARAKELKISVAEAEKANRVVEELAQWSDRDVCWLDELARLSQKFPPAKEARLTSLKFNPLYAGGSIDLDALVRESATIGRIENDLRDQWHQTEDHGSGVETPKQYYSWWFKSAVRIAPKPEKP